MSLFRKLKIYAGQELADLLPWVLLAYIGGIWTFFAWGGRGMFFVLTLGGVTGIMMGLFRKNGPLGWLVLSFCLGWGNIAFQMSLKEHPVLAHALYQTRIEADVLENQILTDRQILTLGQIRWQNPDLKMPQKIRVHFKYMGVYPQPGDRLNALVSVYPPDSTFSKSYERQLWFQQIGATGVVDVLFGMNTDSRKNTFLTSLRQKITQRLFALLPREQAEIAAALITGEQKLVAREMYQRYRRSGIVHVLSVSGFHMALLAAFLFFVFRHACALWPRLVLYWNTKKIAAVLAFIGTFLYLGISGFQIPAIRAFIMISFVFAGILMERSVFSMRSLWLAALGILLWSPEKIFSVSFQLSFTAVMVLIAFCTFLRKKPWGRFLKTLVGFVGLNVLVFTALVPLTSYHFHCFLPYGILGNMVFNSVFSFFVMPLLFMGALLMPFGADVPFFLWAGQGIQGVHWGIHYLADLPLAEISLPELSSLGLEMICLGMMLMCFMKTRFKYAGLLFLLGGISVWLFA